MSNASQLSLEATRLRQAARASYRADVARIWRRARQSAALEAAQDSAGAARRARGEFSASSHVEPYEWRQIPGTNRRYWGRRQSSLDKRRTDAALRADRARTKLYHEALADITFRYGP